MSRDTRTAIEVYAIAGTPLLLTIAFIMWIFR